MNSSRRAFLKKFFYGTLSTSVSACQTAFPIEKRKDRLKEDQMFYRRLGRTNLIGLFFGKPSTEELITSTPPNPTRTETASVK